MTVVHLNKYSYDSNLHYVSYKYSQYKGFYLDHFFEKYIF